MSEANKSALTDRLAPSYTAPCNCGKHTTCFLMGSTPPEQGGQTECGKRGINHHMVRHGSM